MRTPSGGRGVLGGGSEIGAGTISGPSDWGRGGQGTLPKATVSFLTST